MYLESLGNQSKFRDCKLVIGIFLCWGEMNRSLSLAPVLRNQKVEVKYRFLGAEFSFTPCFCCVSLSDSPVTAVPLGHPAPGATPGGLEGVCSLWLRSRTCCSGCPPCAAGWGLCVSALWLAEGLAWLGQQQLPEAAAPVLGWGAALSLRETGVTHLPSKLAVPARFSRCLCVRLVCVHVVVPFFLFVLFCSVLFLALFWEFCGLR